MRLGLALRVLLIRAALERHERWTRERLEAYRSWRLGNLREYALAHSPFYRSFHKGLEYRPLAELPVLQKRHLMESYDDVVTDPDVRLQDIRAFINSASDDSLFLDRYRVCATSGTSGEPGVFVYDTDEWAWIIASYARANRWAGVQADLLHFLKMAMIGSPRPSHQSHAVTQSLESGWVHSLNLSTTDPLRFICQSLTAWQPQLLITYSAFAGTLADEQLDGRLNIAPTAVMCVAETLTHSVRDRVRTAWGGQPFESYAATETGCIAGECSQHAGLHIMDDLLEIEVVDENYRPVPPGTMGAKLLVSVLFSRTLPLIRYEIDDAVMSSTEKCACGIPFDRFTRLGGRIAETLKFERPDGTIASLHPSAFDDAIESTDVKHWRITRNGDELRIMLRKPVSQHTIQQVEARLTSMLAQQSLFNIRLIIEAVGTIELAASGKTVLVKDVTPARS